MFIKNYIKYRHKSLQQFKGWRKILRILLIIISFFSLYLMLAVISFNPYDSTWAQTDSDGHIYNLGGKLGAWLSYTLFFIFGTIAYIIPLIVLGLCYIIIRYSYLQTYINCFNISLHLIGILALILTSCALADLNIDDVWYFISGGVIGIFMINIITPYFNSFTRTLFLLFIWAAGFSLYTGYSWLIFSKKIAAILIALINILKKTRIK